VKTVVGADDFATMREVLSRRFKRAGGASAHSSVLSADEILVLDGSGPESLVLRPDASSGQTSVLDTEIASSQPGTVNTNWEPGAAPTDGASTAGQEHLALSTEDSGVSPSDAWALPDLVIIDGGKGQLAAAVQVMRELGVYQIPTVGLAKRYEEIYVPDEDEPIVLPRGSEALYLVQRIRDEAHRFAITFHRQVRGKSATQSALDTIPGVGPKRKKALLRKFGSVRAIREADIDEIASTVGFTRALAEKVKEGV
jgi:excinuclease UvrABC nuclease subunit